MRIMLACWFICCFSAVLWGQEGVAAVERRVVSAQQWEQAAQDLDYSRDVPRDLPKKKQTGTPPFDGLDAGFWRSFFQVTVILLALAAIGYGIYRMLQEPRNKRIARDGAEITVDNLENYLLETDLERFLREALARQDYVQAIRIHFLQSIKNLSDSGAIRWSIEKTNRDYLREMRPHPQFADFQEITHTYEWIWYGNTSLDAARFAELEPQFSPFSAITNNQ